MDMGMMETTWRRTGMTIYTGATTDCEYAATTWNTVYPAVAFRSICHTHTRKSLFLRVQSLTSRG